MKIKIPTLWKPHSIIREKAEKLSVTDDLFNKSLDKFRCGFYDSDESLNRLFHEYLFKQLKSFNNRSRGQKIRRHTRPEHATKSVELPRIISSRETAKDHISQINKLLEN